MGGTDIPEECTQSMFPHRVLPENSELVQEGFQSGRPQDERPIH